MAKAPSGTAIRICIIFVVLYRRLEFEQKFPVLGIIAGAFVIVAREAFDGFERIPQRDRQKMRAFSLYAAQRECAAISRRREIVRNTCLIQVIEIFVGFLSRRDAMPNSGKHEASFPLTNGTVQGAVATWRLRSSRFRGARSLPLPVPYHVPEAVNFQSPRRSR